MASNNALAALPHCQHALHTALLWLVPDQARPSASVACALFVSDCCDSARHVVCSLLKQALAETQWHQRICYAASNAHLERIERLLDSTASAAGVAAAMACNSFATQPQKTAFGRQAHALALFELASAVQKVGARVRALRLACAALESFTAECDSCSADTWAARRLVTDLMCRAGAQAHEVCTPDAPQPAVHAVRRQQCSKLVCGAKRRRRG